MALTAKTVENEKQAGMHGDGNGLYLKVGSTGSKSWIYRYQRGGKRREMGLGVTQFVTLAEARASASAAAELVSKGIDPIDQRDVAKAQEKAKAAESARKSITLRQAVARYVETKGTLWSTKHRDQWERTIVQHLGDLLDTPVSSLGIAQVQQSIKPLWTARPETAERLLGRIILTVDFAKANGWRDTDAAGWAKHLINVLPAVPKKSDRIRHFAAMPYADLPAFWKRLASRTASSAVALQFLILCGSRSGEVRGATAQEFDLANGLWTIPAERMKAGREHRVPLSTQAIELVAPLLVGKQPVDLVFEGAKKNTPMHDMTVSRQIEGGFTVHGFRSAFRDWVSEETQFDGIAAEQCLAHSVGTAVEKAYRRGDLVIKRRAILQSWADFATGAAASNVIPLFAAA